MNRRARRPWRRPVLDSRITRLVGLHVAAKPYLVTIGTGLPRAVIVGRADEAAKTPGVQLARTTAPASTAPMHLAVTL
jgi:hypothetical protein